MQRGEGGRLLQRASLASEAFEQTGGSQGGVLAVGKIEGQRNASFEGVPRKHSGAGGACLKQLKGDSSVVKGGEPLVRPTEPTTWEKRQAQSV